MIEAGKRVKVWIDDNTADGSRWAVGSLTAGYHAFKDTPVEIVVPNGDTSLKVIIPAPRVVFVEEL